VRLLIALLLLAPVLRAQEIRFGDARPASRQHVELLTDSVEVKGGHSAIVELRFRVDPGFHINSHSPKDETLIPTVLKLDSSAVQVVETEYPAGVPFKLGEDTLDVYQGEFRVRVRFVAAPGETNLTGSLRYQACDNAACFPARTLVVKVAVSGK
jgi:DsbC/DsbD-like thiol-disulfide interchange protein